MQPRCNEAGGKTWFKSTIDSKYDLPVASNLLQCNFNAEAPILV